MTSHKFNRREHGFTLVEVLLSITILSLVFLAFSGMLFSTVRVWTGQEEEVSTNQVGQLAMERMVTHLRRTRADSIVISEDKQRIEFAGKNRDGEVTTLAYGLGNDGVLRFFQEDPDPDTLDWSSSPIVNGVTELSFSDAESAAAPHSIIEINMVITSEKGSTRTVRTKVSPRI